MQNRKRDTDVQNRLLDSVGEGKGGMFWENGIDPVNPHIKLDTRSIIYKSTVILFSSVQLLRRVWLFVTPWTAACQGFPVHHQLLELSQTHGHWVGDAIRLIFCLPLLLLPSILPNIRVFSNESVLHIRSPKYWSFGQFQHQSFQWLFRTDFLSDGLVGSAWSPRDSQESSQTPQFKSINSLALSFLNV